jgi:hypothetical protein
VNYLYHDDGSAYCGNADCGCHSNSSYHAEITEGWTPSQQEYEQQQYDYALSQLGDYSIDEEAA